MNNALDEKEATEKYLNDFLDIVEELPDDIAPHVTMLHETTAKIESISRKLDRYWETIHMPDLDPSLGTRTLFRVQNVLIQYQELTDRKIELWRKILDLIKNSKRTLDIDLENLNLEQENVVQSKNPEVRAKPESVQRRSRRNRNSDTILRDTTQGNSENDLYAPSTSKEQRKKVGKANAKNKVASTKPRIDSDEPVYCLCNQVSYGDMVGCDNDDCLLEWFHFPCVNLTSKPKGKWYCPDCRGERSNQMKSRIS